MKKKFLKLQLGKNSIATLKTIKNLQEVKGGESRPCFGSMGGEFFCTSEYVDTCGC